MTGYTRRTQYKESPYAKDLVKIMKAGTGPYTRKMLAEALLVKYPDKYLRDLMNEVSSAIQMDKLSKKNRFKSVQPGWYDLAEKD